MSWAAIGSSVAGGVLGLMGSGGDQQSYSGGTTSTNNWNQSYMNPAIEAPMGFLAGNALQMGTTPTPYWPGYGYVAPSMATQQGVDAGLVGVSQMAPYLQQSQANYGFLSGAADVANNPYVQSQLAANAQAVNQQLTDVALPAIAGSAQQVNALGSSRQGLAEAGAAEGAANALAQANAQTMLGAYGQGLQAQQYALGQTGNMLANQIAPANALLGIGGVVEGYQQAALDDAMSRYYYQYQEPWQRMGNVQGTMTAFSPYASSYGSGGGSTSNYYPNQNYMSPFQSMIGGAATGYGMYNQYNKPAASLTTGTNSSYMGYNNGVYF